MNRTVSLTSPRIRQRAVARLRGDRRALAMVIVILIALSACKSRKSSGCAAASDADAQCDTYARQVRDCFGATSVAATHAAEQSAKLADAPDAERERIGAMCARDAERLKAACH